MKFTQLKNSRLKNGIFPAGLATRHTAFSYFYSDCPSNPSVSAVGHQGNQ
jgi:hypothetical protein